MSLSTWLKTLKDLISLPPQSGIAFELKKGQSLEVLDPEGQQVADLYCFSKDNPKEALSSGRTIDYNDTLFMTTGHFLYSQQSQKMLKILKDTCGRHDFLLTPCSLEMFHLVSGNQKYHPSCHENLVKAFNHFDIASDALGSTFNIFMNVTVSSMGEIKVDVPLSKAGDFILFEAQMDLIVGLTACSDEGTNNGRCKQIQYKIYSEK